MDTEITSKFSSFVSESQNIRTDITNYFALPNV